MAYDITRLKSDMEGALHGTTVNQITNLYGILRRAASDVLADLDPAETKRIVQIENALYNNVYDYVCPTDLKGDRIIDIRPQVNRQLWDVVGQTYNQAFDLLKQWTAKGGLSTIQWNTGVKSIRISVDISPGNFLINNCDTTDQNGTWAAFGDATNLVADNLNFVEGQGSLKFDMGSSNQFELLNGQEFLLLDGDEFALLSSGPGTGYLENSTMAQVDLSTINNQGAIFCWVYIPDPDSATSFNLRWGSSSTAYWDLTVTEAQDGTDFQNGWNLLRFEWADATQTGSPDDTAIDYVRFTVNTDGTGSEGWRLDAIYGRLGAIWELEYYSKDLFRDAVTGAFKENPTTDSDIINLDTDSYQVYFNRVMLLAAQQLQGTDAMKFDAAFFDSEYKRSLARYQGKYKSEVQKPAIPYYSIKRGGYGRYIGKRWFN